MSTAERLHINVTGAQIGMQHERFRNSLSSIRLFFTRRVYHESRNISFTHTPFFDVILLFCEPEEGIRTILPFQFPHETFFEALPI